ncbi:MAG: hypothetical protein AB1486_04945 [Planctomycetota bacterium]
MDHVELGPEVDRLGGPGKLEVGRVLEEANFLGDDGKRVIDLVRDAGGESAEPKSLGSDLRTRASGWQRR